MGIFFFIQTFPSKIVSQRDTHKTIFDYMSDHLFQGTSFPVVHYPSRKPMAIRQSSRGDSSKKVRIFTFRGVSAFGIPRFPTRLFDDFAWVPKPKLSEYFD